MRLSEAHARLHLNDFVRESDVDMAIRIIVSSFVETQKFSVAKQVSRNCVQYVLLCVGWPNFVTIVFIEYIYELCSIVSLFVETRSRSSTLVLNKCSFVCAGRNDAGKVF